MPDFHRLNRSKTAEMSREELNRRLREEEEKKNRNKKKAKTSYDDPKPTKKQRRISEEAKKQLPPQSPVRKQREAELSRQRKEEKRERERAKRRKKRGSNVIYYTAAAFIALVIFLILSVTVLFNADKIVVEGDEETKYSAEEIIAASGLTGTENLVRLNTSGIPNRILDALVSLDDAQVKKVFPSTIKITVTPAVPMANFYYAGKNYVISHVGRVMEIDNEKADCMEVVGYQPGDNVIIGDYIKAADPVQDELVAQISDAAERAGLENITRLDISDNLGIVITYDDRVKILIGSILELDQKMTIAVDLLANHVRPDERVSLDITNTDRTVQRPLTTAPVTTAPPRTLPPETDEAEGE